MLRIIIADDEFVIVELCRALITYPGAKIVGEACNGIDLLKKIRELNPDVVITDICMPGMTGLELIERAKQEFPAVNFIVMSGYTEFQYAQTALRFGVWDYLLKPLKKAELNRALEKLDHELGDRAEQRQEAARVQNELQESMDILREQYVRTVWETGHTPTRSQRHGGELFVLDNAKLQCVTFCIDSNFTASSDEAGSLVNQVSDTLEHIRALAQEHSTLLSAFSDHLDAVCLLSYSAEQAESESETLLRAIRQEIRSLNSVNHLIHLTGAASKLLDGDTENIPTAVEQSKTALKWRLEKRQSSVLVFNEQTDAALREIVMFYTGEWENLLSDAVEHMNTDSAAALIRRVWSKWESENIVPGSRYFLLEQMLSCLNNAAEQLPRDEQARAPRLLEPFDVLCSGYSCEELATRFVELTAQMLENCRQFVQNRENNVIRQAKNFVTQHYAESISLAQVAKHVCLSTSYFSTLFKTETGVGFVEYLQHIRIEQAKKLLKTSKMRIADIAEKVGYRDIKFFNKIFVKETTVTPSEYRKFYS